MAKDVTGDLLSMTPSPGSASPRPARIAALELRARLSDRQPFAARRHTARLSSRIGLLLGSDLAAFVLARGALRAIADQQVFGARLPASLTAAGPLADPGKPGSTVFIIALLFALSVTGSYTRHRGLNTAARLAASVALAVAAAAVPLAAIVGVAGAIVNTLIVGLGTWVALVLVRRVTENFLAHVWPRGRWAAPAILIGA